MDAINVHHSVSQIEENHRINGLSVADEDGVNWCCIIIDTGLHARNCPRRRPSSVPCCRCLRPSRGEHSMNCECHSSGTRSEVQILEIHAEAHRVNVHAWVERNLTEISTQQETVFILTSIEANHVRISVKVGICKTAEDGHILNIGVRKFFNLVSSLELIGPRMIVVVHGLWITNSDNPS